MLDQDFSDMRKAHNLTDTEVCELFEDKASDIVKAMDYKGRNAQSAELLLR